MLQAGDEKYMEFLFSWSSESWQKSKMFYPINLLNVTNLKKKKFLYETLKFFKE